MKLPRFILGEKDLTFAGIADQLLLSLRNAGALISIKEIEIFPSFMYQLNTKL